MSKNDNIKEVGLKFTVEDGVKFQKTIKEIKNDMNLATAEFQKATSEMDRNKDAFRMLSEKQTLYQRQIESQKEKISILNTELNKLSENEEKNADAISKKKAEIARAETQLNKYEKSLSEVNKELSTSFQENQKLEKELKSLGSQLEQVKADYEKEISALKENTTQTEKLTAKKKLLENETKLQEKTCEDLSRQLELLCESEEENAEAIAKKKLELTKAETQLNKYKSELKNTDTELNKHTKTTDKICNKLDIIGNKCVNLGKKFSVLTAVIAGVGSKAVSIGMDFESSMRQVAATMGITADEIANGSESYKILEEAAQKCGETTKYSASEAADGLNYLALAGYDAKKSAEVLPKVLNLAAAGNLDLATASDMVTDAMAALNLETKDLDKYIDQMAKTSQKSNTSVSQLGEATLTCAGTVSMAKMSLDTMNAELGILANNGIKGAEGGTHLRNIILSLVSPTDTASKALKNLGINVSDSKGNVRDLNDIMSDFNKKLDSMSDKKKTDIISTIFNKTDISAVNALIKGSGDEFANLKKELSNCNGAAQDMADTMNSSVEGQLTLVKSQAEGIAVTISKRILPIISNLLSKVSNTLEWFSKLDSSMQNIILIILAVIAVIGPLLLIIGGISLGISALIPLFTAMSTPILVVIGVITALIAAFSYLLATNEEFRNNMSTLFVSIQALFSAFLEWLGSVFGAGFDEKFGLFKEILNSFSTFISDFMNSTIQFFRGILEFLTGVFTGDWQLVFSGLENIVNGWMGIIDSIFSLVQNIFNNLLTWISGVFLTDWSNYFGAGGDILNRIFSNNIRNN